METNVQIVSWFFPFVYIVLWKSILGQDNDIEALEEALINDSYIAEFIFEPIPGEAA